MFNNTWNDKNYELLRCYLIDNSDNNNKSFNDKIINTTKYKTLGVRVPILRKIAKSISKTDYKSYLDNFNYKYYEEIFIYGIVLSYIKDKKEFIKYLDIYVDKIDNWALCDSIISSFKIIKKDSKYFYKLVKKYLKSKKEYYVRTSLVILLNYYVDEEYLNDIFNIADNLNREEYYINMALAWLLSFCYIKYPDVTYNYLLNNKLSKFTYNKTISKICDSYRVSKEDKEKLRKIRI